MSTSGLSSATDKRGAFEVRGVGPHGALRLRAHARGHAQGEYVEVSPGARDVRLLLPRGAELTGSVIVGDPPPAGIRVTLRRASDSEERLDGHDRGDVEFDGTFALTDLRPGDVDVEIRGAVQHEPLLVVDHVMLVPGETTADLRLQKIDLRDARPLR
jgi:hypothetical protein